MADGRGRAIEVLSRRVEDANALIDAIERLRRTLDRYGWLRDGWYTTFGQDTRTSGLQTTLATEFGAVASAARKLGGRRVVAEADRLDDFRADAVGRLHPPDDTGLGLAGSAELKSVVDTLLDEATRAARRKRWMEGTVLVAFVAGTAIGAVLGFALRVILGG